MHSGGARHFLNYSIFPPGHFARLFLIHRRNIPPFPRHGPRIFPRNFTVATLQQRCMPNKHPRLTSPSRIYVPRIPRREESVVEEASVAGLPLTIVVKINSLLPSSHTIENLCPRLSFLNCSALVARLKIFLANFATNKMNRVLTQIKIRVERKSNDSIRLGSIS